jgi:hypothetical protein
MNDPTRRIVALALILLPWLTALPPAASAARNTPLGYRRGDSALDSYLSYARSARDHEPQLGPWHAAGPFERNDRPLAEDGSAPLDKTYQGPEGTRPEWREVDIENKGLAPEALGIGIDPNKLHRWRHRFWACRTIRSPRAGTYAVDLEMKHCRASVYVNGLSVRSRRGVYVLPLRKGVNHLALQLRGSPLRGHPLRFRQARPVNALVDALAADFGQRQAEAFRQHRWLSEEIRRGNDDRRAAQALRPEANIAETDVDPLALVLRRTKALLEHLRTLSGTRDLAPEARQLRRLASRARQIEPDAAGRMALFIEACSLRRRVAFANPLLDFDRMVFLTHHRASANHMCDQYFGFNARPGGSVWVLKDPFTERPEAVDVLRGVRVQNGRLGGKQLVGGSMISLDLDYDARRVAFAYTQATESGQNWSPERSYHVFTATIEPRSGQLADLRQLTDGPTNDFDPVFLPGGRIAFISERRGGFGRCHGRPVPTYTLHSMLPDGKDIITLSYHETNEWHPSVDNEGMIVYTRWDYVDRDSDVAHHPWVCFPDGRDPRSYHGNYPRNRRRRPWMELSVRAIPGSHRYLAVAAPHHGQAYGSLILLDQQLPDDNECSQLRRITPETRFPESEGGRQAYGSPWPLNEDFYLCVYDRDGEQYGIYLVDSFGNRVLIHRDAEIACLDPIPLRPRPRPPVIPSRTRQAIEDRAPGESPPETSTVAVMDVYAADFDWPTDAKVEALRIVQLFPKATPSQNSPRIGVGLQSLARGVLGTVPVEDDGSAQFTMPAGIPVYFQALDANGVAIQSMKSDTYTHAGERLTCLGCHEPKRAAGNHLPREMPQALQREPSAIRPEVDGSYPVLFPRLVQPVLDAKCVGCHARNDKAPGLSGKPGAQGWSESYHALKGFAWAKNGGNGSLPKLNKTSYSVPGDVGARASKLYRMLKKGHHGVTLSPGQWRRITLWLDTNSNFYGAYLETDKQSAGQVVQPTLE